MMPQTLTSIHPSVQSLDTYRTLTVHQKGMEDKVMLGMEDKVMTKINLFPYFKELTSNRGR